MKPKPMLMSTPEVQATLEGVNPFCFPLTKGLIRGWELQMEGRSTEYTYFVLNKCTCGKCPKRAQDIDLSGGVSVIEPATVIP